MSTSTELATFVRALAGPESRYVDQGASLDEPVPYRSPKLPRLLLASDLAPLAVVGALCGTSLPLAALFLGVFVVFAASAGLYRSRLSLSVLDDLPRLLTAWLCASAVALAAGSAVDSTSPVPLAAGTGGALILSRVASYALTRRLRSSGVIAHRTLVLGTTEMGQTVEQVLRDHPVYGLRPVGFVDLSPAPGTHRPLPTPGLPGRLADAVERLGVTVAVFAYDQAPEAELVPLIRSCHRLRCELFVIPNLSGVHGMSDDTELIWGIPMVRLRRAAHRTLTWRLKRLLDVVVAVAALLVLSPLLVAISLAVLVEGGRGVVFRQTRVGIDGRTFSLMKFRTLRPVDEVESQTTWNIADDERVGRVGRLLRRSSLDELPQLVNIVRGEMSLVGPRPERPYFVEQFRELYPSYGSRDRVPSGLTGWAQVHGLRGDTPVDERADFDNFYIENWSLWLDLKIMLKTVSSVFRAAGS